jgi:hypothetical protein
LIIFYGCKGKIECNPVEIVSSVSRVDSTYFANRLVYQKALELHDLRTGIDGVGVRINTYYGILKKRLLLDMIFSEYSVSCKFFTLDVDLDTLTLKPFVVNSSVKDFRIFFRNNEILDSLTKYGLFTIRTDEEIPGWRWGLHEDGWIVQYVNCKEYRIYSNNSFLDPYNRKRQQEAQKIIRIIKYLETELKIELIPKDHY